jgi:hypothetical protein
MEPDGGVTNVRITTCKHWKQWLGVENRCVVPFTSFSEFSKVHGGDVWFAFNESRPLAVFAGIWTTWTSVRKVKEGLTTNDLFAFLTTKSNAGNPGRPLPPSTVPGSQSPAPVHSPCRGRWRCQELDPRIELTLR